MGTKSLIYLANYYLLFLLSIWPAFSASAQEKSIGGLADAFSNADVTVQPSAPDEEVEPIVVGREKWNIKPESSKLPSDSPAKFNDGPLSKIEELDPLETKQNRSKDMNLNVFPPTIPPAVNLNRNFEGKLVLKTRSLGFQKDFPFQLENSRGKRLAYVDIENLKIVDPIDFKNKQVNILGKLEPIKEGNKDLVIRARILRGID